MGLSDGPHGPLLLISSSATASFPGEAEFLDKPFCGGRYIFQCKRYAENNVVGSPAIRDFYGAVTADRAVKGIFVTTSDFSAQAKEFAAQVGIELVNRSRLNQLLEEYKIGN
jgi:restriction endonuclease Mrr